MEELEQLDVSRWVQFWDTNLPKLIQFGLQVVLAICILIVGRQLIHFIRKLLRRSLERAGTDAGVMQFLDQVVRIGLYVVLGLSIADKFGVNVASVVALLGSLGLAVGLALQGSMANFAGGVLILILHPFRVGDYIIQDAYEGTVKTIQLFYTTLATGDNRTVIIPNGTLANNSLINVTAQEKRRVDILVGIAYNADLKKAKEICMGILNADEAVLKEEEYLTAVTELAASSVNLNLRFWVKTEDYWTARWRVTETLKLEFDANGIEIPFDQLDVNIKK